MNTVKFGEYQSYENLKLILTSKTIGSPAPKYETIDVPGADGIIDYTEYFGDVKYNNRNLQFDFTVIDGPSEFLTTYSRLLNLFNGKKMRVSLSDDPNYYYIGRVSVNEWRSDRRIGSVTINVDAEPYKYKNAITTMAESVTGTKIISCQNSRKQVIPKITASAEVTVKFGTYSRTFGPGSITDDNIVFVSGPNVLTITPTSGTAVITIEYQEGEL